MNAISESYRIGGEVRLPDWLMKMNLSTGVKLTYTVLATCSGGRDQAWPGQGYLASRVSVSVRSIQRYLTELVKLGLIAISRKNVKGKNRCVYTFLRPGQEFEHKDDNLSSLSTQKAEPTLKDTTQCRLDHDNLSPSLIKEESIKGKEYLPPTPQASEPGPEQFFCADISGRESGDFEKGEEEKILGERAWSLVRELLRKELGYSAVQTWLDPLKIEGHGKQVILKAPNPFFLNWVNRHYADGLRKAFCSFGCEVQLELEEITPEEKASRQVPPMFMPMPAANQAQTEPDWSSLSQDEQFIKIFETYPRQEKFKEGLDIFKNLVKQGICPAPSKLFQAISKLKRTANWQREDGRFVPQIPKWLAAHRWLDALQLS